MKCNLHEDESAYKRKGHQELEHQDRVHLPDECCKKGVRIIGLGWRQLENNSDKINMVWLTNCYVVQDDESVIS